MQIFTPFITNRKYRAARIGAGLLVLVILVTLLAQTALAQNTYVITDGDQVTYHTSFASDPAVVLDEAGFRLDSNDSYTTEASGGVSEITVRRGQRISIDYCGRQITATSYGEPLGEILSRLGLQTLNHTVSHDLNTLTYDGMEVRITNLVEATETYTVEIPAETIYCDDPTLPAGQEKILAEGASGQLLCTANVIYRNSQEYSRTVLEQTVVTAPSDRIVAVGTGEAVGEEAPELYIGDGVIILPTGEVLTYTDSASFVATAYTHMDAGCDFITATGTTVHWGTVAVDPRIIPYGTRMFIVSDDGYIYGISTAEDCGGAILGNRVDLYMPTLSHAFEFGRRNCTIYFLGESEWRDW